MNAGFRRGFLVLLLVFRTQAADGQTDTWHTLAAPAAAFEAAGVPLDDDRSQLMLRLIRLVHSVPADHDDTSYERVTAALDDTAGARVPPTFINLPLPLSADVWSEAIFQRAVAPHALFNTIIADRDASLLYYGLSALTPETRGFLRGNLELLRWVYRERSGALAAYGGSIRIVRGQVDLPGGDAARPLWEALVQERVSQPVAFLKQLLGRDEGRLAYFYESIDLLDGPRQRFALGLSQKDIEDRAERFKVLYRAFTDIEADHSQGILPFAKPMYDAATLLQVARVTPDGALAAPAFRKLWRIAFDSFEFPYNAADRLGDVAEEGVLDAAALAELVVLAPAQRRRERFEAFAFGQRAFAAATAREHADVLVALRAFARFPALMLLIERLGVSSPWLYASVARHARAIEQIDGADRQVAIHAQFQGALAILDRLARTGRLPRLDVERLLASLEAVTPDSSHGYGGRMFAWIDHGLLHALRGGSFDSKRDIERYLLAGLADVEAEPGQRFEWEGLPYVVSVAASDTRRIEAIRSKQGGNTLDALLRFSRDIAALGGPAVTLEQLKTIAAALSVHAAKLTPGKAWPGLGNESAPDLPRTVDRALKDLARLRKPKDIDKAARIAESLNLSADYLLGEVLVALAYAPLLGDPEQLLGGEADVAHKHDFGVVTAPSVEARKRAPWHRARQVNSTVVGSVLGLDLVLAQNSLRRLASDRVPELPRLKRNDREVFAESVVLMNPRLISDTDMARMAAAIKEGRRRVVAAASDPAALDALAASARMSASRRQLLGWAAAHDAANVPNLFSIREMLDIGGTADANDPRDAFGLSEEALTGCFCSRFPRPGPWEVYSGRPGTGQLAIRAPDLTLRVTELLSELNAPAALLPAVLALATQDFVDEAPTLYADDWPAVIAYARALPRERVEDYIAALTAIGPLRPYPTNQQ